MKLLLIPIAALFLAVLQSIFYRKFWDRGLFVSLSFSRAAAVEGENAQLLETIRNAKALPIPILHVKFQMGKYLVFTSRSNSAITDQNYRSDIFSCMPWQEIRRTLDFTCTHRGYYTINHMDLVGYDLFLSRQFVSSPAADAVLCVYPRPADPVRLRLPLQNLMGQALAKQALLADPFEVRSIRPYEASDPRRNINWKSSARTGGLKVNVYSPTASLKVTFLLDTAADRLWTDEALAEESVRLCASMADELIRQGVPVSILSDGTDCLTQEAAFLPAGAGDRHMTSVLELLSRLQLSCIQPQIPGAPPKRTMEELIQNCADAAASSDLFVLLSSRQHRSLLDSFEALCGQNPGSLWILPLRPNETVRITAPRQAQFYPWEVPYDHTKTV